MNSRIKLFIMFLMMLLTAALTIYITYAWFTMTEKSKPIIIATGSLNQMSSFYVGIDPDYDGIFGENDYQKITKANFSISTAIPGQIYSFKFVVINEGTVDGVVTITMNDIVASNVDILSGFTLKYIDANSGLSVEKTLDQNDNNKIVLVSDAPVSSNHGSFEFYFTLTANGTIPANLRNESLEITNYIISLIQADYE